MNTYIAVDIGASSGRLMKSELIDGRLTLSEVHRFKNYFSLKNNHQRWNVEYLINQILIGLEKLKKSGVSNCFVGIDTWAVDYCLIDSNGAILANPVAYRDHRTQDAVEQFQEKMSLETLYEKTGIQVQPFNTIFQLLIEDNDLLAQTDKLLLIPDYLGYVFTNKMVTEKTNASTMQLLNPSIGKWDSELLQVIGVKETLFPPLVEAGTVLGTLVKEKFPEYDLPEATFITVGTHDTASAIIGTPGQGKDWGYISSGTWSLLGIETTVTNVTRDAFNENYTNEWGAHNTIRFLKNIMGMWLIQEVARIQEYQYTYPELAEMAAKEQPFQQFIDVNDESFLNPDNMVEAIQAYCIRTKQTVPETPGELARAIYDNLALCYADELQKLEKMTGTETTIKRLHIVGGGSNNQFLNQLTSDIAQIAVTAGPGEATAIGNIIMQMVASKEFTSIEEGRKCILVSFPLTNYVPKTNQSNSLKKYQEFIKGER